MTPEQVAEFERPTREKYEIEGSPYYSTARLWDDGVLDPAETRTTLALGLSAAFNAPVEETEFGVFGCRAFSSALGSVRIHRLADS